MKVLAPCLNVSRLLKPPKKAENIHDLHAGWVACRNGEPFDMSQPPAWQVGYSMWQERELDAGIKALRQALMAGGLEPGEAPMPRVFPSP